MTVQELGNLLTERKATLELEDVPKLQELLDQLEPYVQYDMYGLTKEQLREKGLPLSLFGFATSCLQDDVPPFRFLVIDEIGDLNAWRTIEGAEREIHVRISDITSAPTENEFDALLGLS